MLPMLPKSATLEISEKRQSILETAEEDEDKFFMPATTSPLSNQQGRNSDDININININTNNKTDSNVPASSPPSSLTPSHQRNTNNTVGVNIGGEYINVNRASSYVLGQTEENRIKFDLNPAKMEDGKKSEGAGKEDSESSSLAERTTATATDHIVKKFRQKFIILHYSPFKAVWDWVVLLLVVYTAVFTPFTVAFLLNEDEKRAKLNQHASTRLFKKQNTGADPFVVIDLIVDLITTFVSKEGEAIYDPMIIAKNYLRGWFFIDAFSAMPYDFLLYGSGNIDSIKITGLLKTLRLIRLIRIFPKLQKFSEYGLAMLLLLLAVFALVGHWLACVFYAIAYLERPTLPEPKYSWLDHLAEKYNMPFQENNSESGPDLKSKYITALFFTLTSLTSVGFGNVSPNTNYEKMFSICSMMLGSLISAAIFGNVTTIMMKMYQGTEELKEMQESVKDFIKFHSIPKHLERRMQESFEHTWSYTNGIDMNTVLKSFPESLQADICLHLNRQLLNTCPAFQDASDGCLRMLALRFNSTHVPPGDTLIHKGDNLTAIYFIARGTLEISRDDEVLAILDKHDIFGENIGKYQERDVMGRSSCDVRALSYCDLHKIERCDLLDVMETYPDFADSFEQKFHVTYDLRECELSEQKPTKKKASKGSKSSTMKRASKASSKSAVTPPSAAAPRLSTSHLPLSLPAPPLQLAVDKPIFQIENVDNDDSIEQRYLRSSISSVKRLDTSNLLESTNVSQSPSFLVQKQRSVTSYGSAVSNSSSAAGAVGAAAAAAAAANSGVINVNPARRVSGILRKKSRIIRSMARLMPAQVPTIAVAQSATSPAAMSATAITIVTGDTPTASSNMNLSIGGSGMRRQISNLSEVESEIDNLVARVSKLEENLRTHMDELSSFIFNFIVTESMPKTSDACANTNITSENPNTNNNNNNNSNENSNSNSIN